MFTNMGANGPTGSCLLTKTVRAELRELRAEPLLNLERRTGQLCSAGITSGFIWAR
jgi:hypothetical protein